MTTQYYEEKEVLSGSTLPILELAVTGADGETASDLTGFGVYVTFWYVGAAPHWIGQGYISDAAAGKARYELTGSETPTAGLLYYQWTLDYPGLADMTAADAQTWGSMTSDPFIQRVIEAAP